MSQERLWALKHVADRHFILAGTTAGKIVVVTDEARDTTGIDWQEPIRVSASVRSVDILIAPLNRDAYLAGIDPVPDMRMEHIEVRKYMGCGVVIFAGFGPKSQKWVVREPTAREAEWTSAYPPCTCPPECSMIAMPCKGKCGCQRHQMFWTDVLDAEYDD